MKIYVLILLAILAISVKNISCEYSESGFSSHSSSHSKGLDGIWKSKRKWTYYWVKEWEVKKVFIPIWKKIWTPVEIKEWIPVPNTPHK